MRDVLNLLDQNAIPSTNESRSAGFFDIGGNERRDNKLFGVATKVNPVKIGPDSATGSGRRPLERASRGAQCFDRSTTALRCVAALHAKVSTVVQPADDHIRGRAHGQASSPKFAQRAG
jgi:hypothetical protein